MRSKIDLLLAACLTLMCAVACAPGRATAQTTCELASDCDDGDECTQDRCIDGVCVFPLRPVGSPCSDDGKECTRDLCMPGPEGFACVHPDVSPGSPCGDDGNECTRDACFAGETGFACQHFGINPGSPCSDDGNACTRDACFFGPESGGIQCMHMPQPFGSPCPDEGNDCTLDLCAPDIDNGGQIICSHQGLSFGSPCADDGNDCTDDVCVPTETSTFIECRHNSRAPGSTCDDQSPCTPYDACDFNGTCVGSLPATDCRGASKSSLVIKDNDRDDKDLLSYEWRKGEPIDSSELGDPTATTDYTLCVFDGNGRLQLSAGVPAAGTCNGSACWEAKSAGFAYRDDFGLSNGIGKIRLNSGTLQKTSAQVRGKGAALPLPSLPLVQPVQVQLINDETGVCLGSFFGGSFRNTEKKFIAQTP